MNHDHPPPDRLGTVQFENSCANAVQADFLRAVALLHSFAYAAAAQTFAAVAQRDPHCAMAQWGMAMSRYHPLWSPPPAADIVLGRQELERAQGLAARTQRERQFITAAAAYFNSDPAATPASRARAYCQAMAGVARSNPADTEAQIFYALALLATAPPTDRTHANQKQAAAILEPIYRRQPDHPGAAHYLIHAYDSSELASRGLAAARAYATIAPAAPHALHMPSHIYTRLGLWNESIAANEAARRAAHAQGDVGEELHAMDYLTYASLQLGREADAERIVAELRAMGPMLGGDFKVGYAATAMPVRLAIERQRWSDAVAILPLTDSAPHVAALVHWAHAIAHAHSGDTAAAARDGEALAACAARASEAGDHYWAAQIAVLITEAQAASAAAAGNVDSAVTLARAAADQEDGLEKLPVTPGPIVPAREQLGLLLLDQQQPRQALVELDVALKEAPGRRAALLAAIRAAGVLGDAAAVAGYRAVLEQ